MDILKGERSNEEKEDLVGRPADHLYERIVAHCAPDPLFEEQQLRKNRACARGSERSGSLVFASKLDIWGQKWGFCPLLCPNAHFYPPFLLICEVSL